jgi:WD40 repeat protein
LGKIGRPLFRISDDSRTIVALSSEDPTTVNVWDVETGKLTAELSSTETYTGRIVNVLPFVAPDSSCVGIRLMVDVRKSKYDQYALVWDVAAAMVVRRQQDASKVLHLGQYFPSRMFSFRKVADTALAEDLLSRERLQGPLPTGMNRAEIDRIYIGENCHCKWWSVEYPWNEDRFWLQKQTTEPLFRPFAMHARHVREYYDIASGSFLGEIHHHFGMPSYNAEFLATVYTDGTIAVWDTPPRRPVGLILLLAALHTGLIVGACWWWSRRA